MDVRKLAEQFAVDQNKSDTLNAKIGSDGTNVSYDKAQGDRGKHLNPTWQPNKPKPGAPDEDAEGDFYGPVGGAD